MFCAVLTAYFCAIIIRPSDNMVQRIFYQDHTPEAPDQNQTRTANV
jgi:hypothetical protein